MKRTSVLFWAMSKGVDTRRAILDHALEVATKEGLEGLTIGRLAQDLRLSKSGLFAHFRGKEALLLQVLETARARFIEQVVKPGLAAPRGSPASGRSSRAGSPGSGRRHCPADARSSPRPWSWTTARAPPVTTSCSPRRTGWT